MHQLGGGGIVTDAEHRLAGRVQRLEHDRKQVAAQRAHNSDVENIYGETRPQLSAEQGEGGNVALHLPAGGDAAREIRFVGDDQNCRRFHGLISLWVAFAGGLVTEFING